MRRWTMVFVLGLVACGGAQRVTPEARIAAGLQYGACVASCTFEAMDAGLFAPSTPASPVAAVDASVAADASGDAP